MRNISSKGKALKSSMCTYPLACALLIYLDCLAASCGDTTHGEYGGTEFMALKATKPKENKNICSSAVSPIRNLCLS